MLNIFELTGLLSAIQAVAMVLFALFMHEAAHIIAVTYLGGRAEKIGVFPIGMRARFVGLEKLHGWERYIVYGAGSFANLVLAAWMLTVSWLSHFGVTWMETLAFYSIIICLFNLLPALPLDGGRFLHQFLANCFGILRANRFMLRCGIFVSTVLIALGLIQAVLYNYNITLFCAGVYILRQNREMKPKLHMDFFLMLEGKNASTRRHLPAKKLYVTLEMPLKYVLERLTMDYVTEIHVIQKGAAKDRPRKEYLLRENVLLAHIFAYGLHGTINDVITQQQPSPENLHLCRIP